MCKHLFHAHRSSVSTRHPGVFVRWLPRLLVLIAVLMPLQILIPSDRWVGTGLSFLWAWVVPANPVDFVSSVVLVILAGALSIRKRAAWWVLLLLLVFTLAATGAVAVVLALVKPSLLTWDLATSMIVPALVLICLLVHRRRYTAKTQPWGFFKALAVLVSEVLLTVLVVLAVQFLTGGLSLSQARQIIAELFGFRDCTDSSWMLSLFGFGSVTSIILAFWTMLRSQRFAEHIDLDEERAIRQSLADHSNDSLGYFSTRRDRSALFAGDFSLADLPEVQRAVAKLTRLGYTLRIRQQSETPADELASLAAFADEWRDGETERGFSMALGRMGDSADARTLHVEALFPVHDAKHPPPSRRRERGTEFMIAGLMREAGGLGIAELRRLPHRLRTGQGTRRRGRDHDADTDRVHAKLRQAHWRRRSSQHGLGHAAAGDLRGGRGIVHGRPHLLHGLPRDLTPDPTADSRGTIRF